METASIGSPAATACFHCGQESATPLKERIKGEVLSFCCTGCLQVCRYIHEAGLDAYYQKRDRLPEGVLRAEASGPSFDGSNTGEAALIIDGIHCSACVWLIEKVTGKMDGVASSNLNFSTQRLSLRWDTSRTSLNSIIERIRSIGYTATPYDTTAEAALGKKRDDILVRTAVAGFGALSSMFLAEGLYAGYLWGIQPEYKSFLEWASMFVAAPVVFFSGWVFIKAAFNGLKNRAATMDLPVALGALITYFYSVFSLVNDSGGVYFDSAAMFVFLILAGRYLEAAAKKKAFGSLSRLKDTEVKTAAVIRNGSREIVPLSAVKPGDIVEVRPGERVPLDGVIIEGGAAIDESMLTGESAPVAKAEGSEIYGSTINTDGVFSLRVTKDVEQTMLSRIKKAVEAAGYDKARVQLLADKVAAWFIPFILLSSLFTYAYWSLGGNPNAVIYSVAVLIITCPCALALATPAAIIAGSAAASRRGILIKSSAALERLHKVRHVVFDKTGTLTEGRMDVVDIIPAPGCTEAGLLESACLAESGSEHPIGRAIVKKAEGFGFRASKNCEGFRALAGMGVEVSVKKDNLGKVVDIKSQFEKYHIYAGSLRLMDEKGIEVGYHFTRLEEVLNKEGKTAVYIGSITGGSPVLHGLIAFADPVRKNSKEVVKRLKDMGVMVTLLTGDREATALKVANELGIENVVAEVLPHEKEDVIKKLKEDGVVAMAGDGINDGPSLARANVGIALSATHLAIEAADIVIMNNDPMKVVDAIEISKKTFGVIRGNLGISLVYNLIMTPLAALGFVVPIIAAIAMPISSLMVIGNSVRAGR